jgi:hypothetical protein
MRTSVCILCIALAQATAADTSTMRGWLSDEACARGRASSGVFTGTNPDCAKRCVGEGKKIVFIDPDGKRVLDIANQNAARNNIGDYVEVVGFVDAKNNALRVESLKLISEGVAACSRPPSKAK